MHDYSLQHLSDDALLDALAGLASTDRLTTARLLAHIAEVERRGLHLSAGFSSMFRYCVGRLRMSGDVAYKRVRAARAARRHPAIFAAIADGRLNVSAVVLLAPHLTRENSGALLAGAEHRSRREIEHLLARLFSAPCVPAAAATAAAVAGPVATAAGAAPAATVAMTVPVAAGATGVAAASVATATSAGKQPGLQATASEVAASAPSDVTSASERLAPGPVASCVAPASACAAVPRERGARLTPIAPGRFELVAILGEEACAQLEASRELLGHAVPSGNLAEVLERAIAVQFAQLRKRRCGAAARPRSSARDAAEGGAGALRKGAGGGDGAAAAPSDASGQGAAVSSGTAASGTPRARVSSGASAADPRRIPAAVLRAVWERDGGRCAFVSAEGHRCGERGRLEVDHVVPVARGGQATVENLRLLCRAHNRHAAERALGREHVRARREAAQNRRAAERHFRQRDRERAERRRREIEQQREELGEAFRQLGYRGRDLECALAYCASRAEAPLEERLKHALRCMAPRAVKQSPMPGAQPPGASTEAA